ncbi:MAG: hypothetical protein OXR62_03880 [Ahrensia sp.]|nr:hypothetical protein [Ahrensia sp.]
MRNAIILFACLILAACANTTPPEKLPQYSIAVTSVSVNPGVTVNSDIAAKTKKAAQTVANAYNASLPQNIPQRQLGITIENVHYKNAALSLLIGDTNRISGAAQIQGEQSKPIAYVDAGGAVVNGILGAAIALTSDKSKTDAKLAAGLAEAAIAAAYDQKGTPKFATENLKNGRSRAPDSEDVPEEKPNGDRPTGPKPVPTS